MTLKFSSDAVWDLTQLDAPLRKRVVEKLKWFVTQSQPLHFAEPLKNLSPATHRFRIGDYRAIIEHIPTSDTILILAVKNQKDVYRK